MEQKLLSTIEYQKISKSKVVGYRSSEKTVLDFIRGKGNKIIGEYCEE